MKLKLTNYDPSEYKQFENDLNNLSKKGYNPSSVDLYTIFKHDGKRYYYKTDIFVHDKSDEMRSRASFETWRDRYLDQGYQYIGHSRKIYVFKSKEMRNNEVSDNGIIDNYFKHRRIFTSIVFLLLSFVLTLFLIPNIYTNHQPSEYISNGTIILHYIPILLCGSLLFRFIKNLVFTFKDITLLNKDQKVLPTGKTPFILGNWLLIISILIVIAGFAIDFIDRKEITVDDRMITLTDLGYEDKDNNYPTMIESHSIKIKESLSYGQTNGNELIKINTYDYNSKNDAKEGLNSHLEKNKYKNKKEITGGYLLSGDDIYRNISFVTNNKLVIIQTNLDLLDNDLYQKIITFYK